MSLNKHKKEIMAGSLVTFVVKLIAIVSAFIINILLARLLGVEGVGMYYLSLTVIGLIALVSRLGLDSVVVKLISKEEANNNYSNISEIYKFSIKIVFAMSVCLSLVLLYSSEYISLYLFKEEGLLRPLKYMIIAIIPMVLISINSEALRGLHKILYSQVIGSALMPLIILLALLFMSGYMSLDYAVYIYDISAVVACVLSFVIIAKHPVLYMHKEGNIEHKKILFPAKDLLIVSLINFLMNWSGTFMLGVYGTAEDVGLFNVAMRIAMTINVLLVAINSVIGPKIAALHELGDYASMEGVVRYSVFLTFVASFPVFIMLLFFSEFVISVFGEDFVAASSSLIVLAIGQLVNVLSGSVGVILTMTGNEKKLRNNSILSLLINLLLMILLTPEYGVFGVAIAVASAMIIKNISALIMVKKYTGLKIWKFI